MFSENYFTQNIYKYFNMTVNIFCLLFFIIFFSLFMTIKGFVGAKHKATWRKVSKKKSVKMH